MTDIPTDDAPVRVATRDQHVRAQARCEEWLFRRGEYSRDAVRDVMRVLAGKPGRSR